MKASKRESPFSPVQLPHALESKETTLLFPQSCSQLALGPSFLFWKNLSEKRDLLSVCSAFLYKTGNGVNSGDGGSNARLALFVPSV